MKYFNIILLCSSFLMIFGCSEDFLDRRPLDRVGQSDYFQTPEDLETYINQFYNNASFPTVPSYGLDYDSDNAVAKNFNAILAGTRTLDGAGGIGFGRVRNINYFFDNYHSVKENHTLDEYRQYLGEAHFFRAISYYDLLQRWGDIQWFSSVQGTESDELYRNRDPRNFVADKIIADLDTAALYLQTAKTDGVTRINKWIALLMQSRVALYEGTWEKYHNGTPFGVANPQPEKYFNKAVEAASQVMESGLYELYSTGSPEVDYYDLFSTHRDYSGNSEVLFWKRFDNELGKGEAAFRTEVNFRGRTPNEHSVTKELADYYLSADGLPISVSPLFQGHQTLVDEATDRDPRFYQTIGVPGYPWVTTSAGEVTNYDALYNILNQGIEQNSPSGYVVRKGYDTREIYQVPQYEETPEIIYRYAEVLLNFAEAKAELGNITQADLDKSINKLRERVGMPPLVLGDIAIDPAWEFPDLSPIINEVRRERRVELALEGFRFDDIMRWAAADELIVGKRPRGFRAAQVDENPYPVDEEGFLDPYRESLPNGYGFKTNRDYLNAIPKNQMELNPNLVQNPGWQ